MNSLETRPAVRTAAVSRQAEKAEKNADDGPLPPPFDAEADEDDGPLPLPFDAEADEDDGPLPLPFDAEADEDDEPLPLPFDAEADEDDEPLPLPFDAEADEDDEPLPPFAAETEEFGDPPPEEPFTLPFDADEAEAAPPRAAQGGNPAPAGTHPFARWSAVCEEAVRISPMFSGILPEFSAAEVGNTMRLSSRTPMFRSILLGNKTLTDALKRAVKAVTGRDYEIEIE